MTKLVVNEWGVVTHVELTIPVEEFEAVARRQQGDIYAEADEVLDASAVLETRFKDRLVLVWQRFFK